MGLDVYIGYDAGVTPANLFRIRCAAVLNPGHVPKGWPWAESFQVSTGIYRDNLAYLIPSCRGGRFGVVGISPRNIRPTAPTSLR